MHWNERRELWNKQAEDARQPGEVDYARIIHSASFRRLQGKTQILNLGDSDFYRTRLTHSLEVAQIAAGIARQLRQTDSEHEAVPYLPDSSMIQAIGMTHDLGHPPFGHGGEAALNYCMRGHGGFEGNGQTLRILSKLEKFSNAAGSNLTRRTLLGVLKYPIPYSRACNPEIKPALNNLPTAIHIIDRKSSKPPKCYLDSEQDVVEWVLKPLTDHERIEFVRDEIAEGEHRKSLHKSLDCSIMELADDIAFGVHDLEDALAMRLIEEDELRTLLPEDQCTSFLDSMSRKYPNEFGNNVYDVFVRSLFGNGGPRKRAISRMVHHFITHCHLITRDQFEEPLVRFRATMEEKPLTFLKALKKAVRKAVILSAEVQHLEFKGQGMVVSVFEALSSEPETLLPKGEAKLYAESSEPLRVVCDYIAGMTDSFLLRTYDRLFSPRMGSVFDRL